MKENLIPDEVYNSSKIKTNEELLKEKTDKAIKKYSLIDKDPYLDHSNISNLFFYWGYKLIKLSHVIPIKHEHIGKLRNEHTSKSMQENLKSYWYDNPDQPSNNKNKSLLVTELRANLCHLIIITIWSLLRHTCRILQIASFRYYLQLFKRDSTIVEHSYSILQVGVFYLTLRFIEIFLIGKTYEYQIYLGAKTSAELNCLIYDKLLRLSTNNINSHSQSGEILNFIQVDSEKLNRTMFAFEDLITLPYSILIYSFLLFQYIGVSFLFGLLTLLIFFYINYQIQNKLKGFQKECMKFKDKRLKISTETFNIIKMLKLYCWEAVFKQKIIDSHESELDLIKKRFSLSTISQVLANLGPIAISIVSIGTYQYFNDQLKIEDIFSCVSAFSSLQSRITAFPIILSNISDTSVAMKRIEKYLFQKEITYEKIQRNDNDTIKKNIAIQVSKCNFSWDDNHIKSKEDNNKDQIIQLEMKISHPNNKHNEKMRLSFDSSIAKKVKENLTVASLSTNNIITGLKNINLTIHKGKFVIILGEVGSGKSSLLHGILNRMNIINSNGQVIINGSVSFVNQVPWIINDTIRNNIIFFQEYDEEKYNKIVKLCELEHDIQSMIGRDMTEIGEKGINLSGGQKIRINLARALYADRDILFLDDITSALDADIAKRIMKNCLFNHTKDKTIILITNTIKYAAYADTILYMKDGEIIWQGVFDQLKTQTFYDTYSSNHSTSNKSLKSESNGIIKDNDGLIESQKNQKTIKKLMKDEILSNGKVDSKVFQNFRKLIGGVIIVFSIILTMICLEGFKGASNMWLGYWNKHQSVENNTKYYFYYSVLGFSQIIFIFTYLKINNCSSIKLSRSLHDSMINSLINASLPSFHDIISKGQIMNRLSKDINQIDLHCMNAYTSYLSHSISFIGAITICSIVQPYSLLFLPLLVIAGLFLTNFYLNCSRELHRLESALRSPIVAHITETIDGLDTIREYHLQDKYIELFQEKIDNNFKVRVACVCISQWFNFNLDFLSFLFFSFLIFVTIYYKDNYSVEEIGIILTYFIPIQSNLIRSLYDKTIYETAMVGVERCMQFTQCTKERAKTLPVDKSLYERSWPENGRIVFNDFSVKYREDSEIVLKNLSFIIKPKEKIGIVGRTGSGKTTLSLCLFRIIEGIKGSICIDDIDISSIGLDLLRKNITIIPQEPALIAGTLRYNIDPLNLHTDEDIINVMKQIGFDYLINQNELGLNHLLEESGSNLSVGEKQLVCITRAILRKSKIVVLDEATASIDYQTEEMIHKAISNLFIDSTVLMIAHRIKTIMNSDKILVLNNGEIAQYDTTEALLRNKNGFFYELYSKSSK